MVSKEGHTKQSLLGDRVMDAIFVEQFSIGVAQSTPGFRGKYLLGFSPLCATQGDFLVAFLHCALSGLADKECKSARGCERKATQPTGRRVKGQTSPNSKWVEGAVN